MPSEKQNYSKTHGAALHHIENSIQEILNKVKFDMLFLIGDPGGRLDRKLSKPDIKSCGESLGENWMRRGYHL